MPTTPATGAGVTLREITADTVRSILRLSVSDTQQGFVANNAVSLAQALFSPSAWYRAIYLGDAPAGFVMLDDESLLSPPPAQPKVGIWRLMVDARYQGRGVGRAAVGLVVAHVQAKGLFRVLILSYVPGPGCPEPFYRGLGFQPTGEMDDDEVVMALPLQAAPPRGPAWPDPPAAMRTLHTPRCTLEPQVATHAEAMFLVLSDPAIYAFENAPPASVAWLRTRYQRLESRCSPDGREQWLNWVLRLPGGDLAGDVQATVLPDGLALVAYELGSRHWRQGIGSAAVQAMLQELVAMHGVHTAVAVLKARNHRSAALLRHLGFVPGPPPGGDVGSIESDEICFHRLLITAGAATTGPATPC